MSALVQSGLILVAIPVLIAILDHLSRAISPKRYWQSQERMPKVLRSSKLYMSETDLKITKPVELNGRVDQVFLSQDKILIPIDTKVTNRIYVTTADQIQLSSYKAMLVQTEPYLVASFGFIRFVNRDTRKVRYQKVKLLAPKEIYQLAKSRTEGE